MRAQSLICLSLKGNLVSSLREGLFDNRRPFGLIIGGGRSQRNSLHAESNKRRMAASQ